MCCSPLGDASGKATSVRPTCSALSRFLHISANSDGTTVGKMDPRRRALAKCIAQTNSPLVRRPSMSTSDSCQIWDNSVVGNSVRSSISFTSATAASPFFGKPSVANSSQNVLVSSRAQSRFEPLGADTQASGSPVSPGQLSVGGTRGASSTIAGIVATGVNEVFRGAATTFSICLFDDAKISFVLVAVMSCAEGGEGADHAQLRSTGGGTPNDRRTPLDDSATQVPEPAVALMAVDTSTACLCFPSNEEAAGTCLADTSDGAFHQLTAATGVALLARVGA
mmetsp:Transcript_38584/g.96899  ORF Transcript_38584/g.96899 Transcript_38584/m.96899 type:complete len:281 (+) Transcript_38584:1038-1880(+)